MRQISASKRSQNVVEIANTDLLRFWTAVSYHSTISVNILPQKKLLAIIDLVSMHI